MAGIVLDASGALSALVPSQATGASRAFLSALPGGLIAPDLFRLEVRAALIKLEARGVLPANHGETGLRLLEAVIGFEGSLGDTDLQRICDLARRLGLSIYDAVYLDLAQLRDASLASRDGGLIRAAGDQGVAVLDLR